MDKHVVNDPKQVVIDSLHGLVTAKAELLLDPEYRVVTTATIPSNQVTLLSGGGSGHEPAMAGMVGRGMLTGAVAGNVFASPNVGQIRRGIELIRNEKGTLIIIMRYTGDVLLFGLAKEQHALHSPQFPIELVVVGDDCAVTRSQGAITGRRGLAGTLLVQKIAGALAENGANLEQVTKIAGAVAGRIGTVGAGLNHCHIPGTGPSESHLKSNEIEIGMGIHNEPGILTTSLPSSRDLISKMLSYITSTSDPERSFLPFKHDGKDEVVLLVNNLGGMSELELGVIARDAIEVLQEGGIEVKKVATGSFMTSLNLPGFSLTLLLLPRSDDTEITSALVLNALDHPTTAPGWKGFHPIVKGSKYHAPSKAEEAGNLVAEGKKQIKASGAFIRGLEAACKSVIAAEPEITRFDTIAGDGDCGTTLKRGAEGVLEGIQKGEIKEADVVGAIGKIAQIVEKTMDGTSGALYSIWTNALAAGFSNSSSANADPSTWSTALNHALNVLYTYTNARPPSRTLVDPLYAFTTTFSASRGSDFGGAIRAAEAAVENTKNIEAKAGRAAYVGQEDLISAKVPDPGAYGVLKILEGVQQVL